MSYYSGTTIEYNIDRKGYIIVLKLYAHGLGVEGANVCFYKGGNDTETAFSEFLPDSRADGEFYVGGINYYRCELLCVFFSFRLIIHHIDFTSTLYAFRMQAWNPLLSHNFESPPWHTCRHPVGIISRATRVQGWHTPH